MSPDNVVLTVPQVANMLGCKERTVEDNARSGELPGLKFGVSWVFPFGALVARLNEMALEGALRRRSSPGEGGSTPLSLVMPIPTPTPRRLQ